MTNDADIKVVIERIKASLGPAETERVKAVLYAAKSVCSGPQEIARVLATCIAIHACGQVDPAKCVASVHEFVRTVVGDVLHKERSS